MKKPFGNHEKQDHVETEDPKYVHLEASYKIKELDANIKLNESRRRELANGSTGNFLGIVACGAFTAIGTFGFVTTPYVIYKEGVQEFFSNYGPADYGLLAFFTILPFAAAKGTQYFYRQIKKENKELKDLNKQHDDLKSEYKELETILVRKL